MMRGCPFDLLEKMVLTIKINLSSERNENSNRFVHHRKRNEFLLMIKMLGNNTTTTRRGLLPIKFNFFASNNKKNHMNKNFVIKMAKMAEKLGQPSKLSALLT